MERRIGKRLISYVWIAVILDHQDGTCSVLGYTRTKSPKPYEDGSLIESSDRTVMGVQIDGEGVLTVRNPQHVFSYKIAESEIGYVASNEGRLPE